MLDLALPIGVLLRQCKGRIVGEGAVAQLVEHLLCKQGVIGSIPISSTIPFIHLMGKLLRKTRPVSGTYLIREFCSRLRSISFVLST